MKRQGDHVENLRLELVEILCRDSRGNDRVVIGHLGVVEDALVRPDPALRKRLPRVRRQLGVSNLVRPIAFQDSPREDNANPSRWRTLCLS